MDWVDDLMMRVKELEAENDSLCADSLRRFGETTPPIHKLDDHVDGLECHEVDEDSGNGR